MTQEQADAQLDAQLRKEFGCRGCGKTKDVGSLVCWDCFKGRTPGKPALKTWSGSTYSWLMDAVPFGE